MSASSGPQKFVDNIGRRTWDAEQFRKDAETAVTSAPASAAPTGPRGFIAARDSKVDLYSNVGKTMAVTRGTRAGFHCAVCDCILSDSQAYLAHLNGRRHQKRLGLSMFVARATLADVRARIAGHVRRLAAAPAASAGESVADRLARARKERQQSDEVARAAKALRRKVRKRRLRGDDHDDDAAADADAAADSGTAAAADAAAGGAVGTPGSEELEFDIDGYDDDDDGQAAFVDDDDDGDDDDDEGDMDAETLARIQAMRASHGSSAQAQTPAPAPLGQMSAADLEAELARAQERAEKFAGEDRERALRRGADDADADAGADNDEDAA